MYVNMYLWSPSGGPRRVVSWENNWVNLITWCPDLSSYRIYILRRMKLAGTNILCLRFPGGILSSSGTKWIPGCQPSYTAQIITRNMLLLDYFLGLQGSQLRIVLGCKDHNWGLAWWCDFFLWGQPLEIIRKYSAKKVQPLGFYFRHLRLDLFKSLFLLVKLNICVCTLLHGQMYLQLYKHSMVAYFYLW